MVNICMSIAGKVAEYTVAPVLRQFGYLIYYKSNVEDLTQKVTSLTAKRDDLQTLVVRAKRNSEIISREVDNWLDRVEQILQEKETCFEKEGVAKATTCWCPNLKVRHSLSRKATKMAPKVDVLLTQGNFTAVSRLEYRLPYTKDLLKALEDDKINMIGISGIIREIDTVTTKEFIKRMKIRNLFEEVVMAVVSQQDPDLKRIQGEIADMLHLKLEDGSLVERAERLRAAMSAILDSKRLLLILADVRQLLDLEAIGISSGDGNKRFKIIFISELPNVFGEMSTQTNFELLLQSTPVARAVEFESRISVIRDVTDALTDDESNPIVLCGMGGIGKTTLVMEIAAKASEVDLFDEVAIAEFTQEPDLVKIQGKIAKDLGLEFTPYDDRAAKLRERISEGTKRVLVILDNVWTDNSSPDQLTLWEVGIPISRDLKCCKVLVSSREQDIFKEMKTKKNFPIGGLPKEDAWSLFKKVAGGSIEGDLELRSIAEQVLDECDGLPVAITTVGRALQGESIPKWRDALRQLKKACPEDVPGVIEHVYGKIEFSYECLPSVQAKSFFLLCCVFPESVSFSVEVLFRLGFGLGLFKGIDSIAEGRDCIETLVDTLKSRFLLLDSDKEGGYEMVKMHDVVRDVAVYIASEELSRKKNYELKKRIVLRQRVKLNGWPTNEESTCISLATSTSTGGLTELLLFIDGSEVELSATIFNGMEDLKVLIIGSSTLPSLPLLKNLQTLILLDCDLNLDAVGELRTLMILDLRGSDVQQLPDTFKNLSNLRLLDLRYCEKLYTIAPGVISSLSRLEELYMWDSFQVWVVEKLASTETTNWISQLEDQERSKEDEESSEEEEVVDIDMWKRFNKLAVEKLASISQLGDEERSEPEELDDLGELYREEIRYSHKKDEFTRWANSMDWTVGILSELLSLSRLTTLQVVLPPVDILLRTSCKLFHRLETFKISIGWEEHEEFKDIEDYENYLRVADLDASSLAGTGITLLLKKTNAIELKLKNLTDPLNVLDCANLESLKLEDCDALTCVWNVESQSRCLGNLAHVDTIHIEGCQSLEAIFGLVGSGHHEEEAALEFNLLSLKSLILKDLPSVTWISNSNNKGLARLPEVSSLYPNCLTVEHSLFFDPKVVLSNLTSLIVHQCDDVRFLLSSSMAKSLVQLKHLQVSKCEIMEEIILTRGYGEENMDNMFSKLENLDLNNLPCLARFCSGDNIRDINFPKVTSVIFRNLPRLTSFCQGMHTSKWPSLKTLKLDECYQVEIFAAEFSSFQKLHQLASLSTPIKQPLFLIEKGSFAKLENLILSAMHIWYGPPSPTEIFAKLKSIDFSCSPFSKRDVFLQMGSSGHGDGTFPHLKKLRLIGMEKLGLNPQPAGPVFPNLEILLLEHCHRLESILRSSAISFQKLTILEVTFCWRLRYLISYSIAKSLVHLQKLKVDECKSMTEIVTIEDGDGDDVGNYVIDFSRLQHLELYDLISLQRFCSPSCIVKIPSSISLRVNYCPVEFKISPDGQHGLLLLEEEDSSNFQKHDQAEVLPKAVDASAASSSGTNQNQPAQDEDAEFDAQEPRGEGFTTELNNDPALPADIPQGSEQGVEAVIQETPDLFSKNLEHAEVMDLKEPVVTKNLQEADLGPIQHLNLIANEDKLLQLKDGSRSQRIAQIDAEIRRLQELRDKEAEMREKEKQLADR